MDVPINFQITLSPEEVDLFCKIFGCNAQQLPAELSKVSSAALNEYLKMIKGEKVFTRGKDMLEYRLLNLVKYFYNGRVPNEQQICALFQITATESRALIRSITSKYQYELETIIFETLKNKLDQEARVNGNADYRIALDSTFYRDEYNKILATRPKYAPLAKESQTSGTYIIRNVEYAFLCQYFHINPTNTPYQ